jgi:hypothetical protein
MPLKYWQYPEEIQLFWNKVSKLEMLTASPNLAEATSAAIKVNEMLRKRGFTRRDFPSFLKRWHKQNNVPSRINGKAKCALKRGPERIVTPDNTEVLLPDTAPPAYSFKLSKRTITILRNFSKINPSMLFKPGHEIRARRPS